jgi:hypothetical protein
VGGILEVLVPPWNWGSATAVSIGNPRVVGAECSFLLADEGREEILVALAEGQSTLEASVTPASNAMMPSWSGTVTVIAAPRASTP